MEASGDDAPPSDELERLKACAGSFRRLAPDRPWLNGHINPIEAGNNSE